MQLSDKTVAELRSIIGFTPEQQDLLQRLLDAASASPFRNPVMCIRGEDENNEVCYTVSLPGTHFDVLRRILEKVGGAPEGNRGRIDEIALALDEAAEGDEAREYRLIRVPAFGTIELLPVGG